jgi:hypothetical protein
MDDMEDKAAAAAEEVVIAMLIDMPDMSIEEDILCPSRSEILDIWGVDTFVDEAYNLPEVGRFINCTFQENVEVGDINTTAGGRSD